MGKTDAFAGPVLRAGTAEQFENTGMIARIDAASVVADVVYDMRSARPARYLDVQWLPLAPILQGIVNEIGENLFHGQTISFD